MEQTAQRSKAAGKTGRAFAGAVPPLVAGGACVLLVVLSLAWIHADSSLHAGADSNIHHVCALIHARALALGGLPALADTARSVFELWPPGTYLLYGVLGRLVGQQSDAVRMCGVLLLPLLGWAVYQLGRELSGPFAGCLAAVLCLFSFGVAGQVRHVSLDLTGTVAVAMTLLCLVRTRDMTRPRGVLMLGLAGGIGLLFRVQFLFFVVGPLLLVGLRALRPRPGRRVGRDLLLPLAGGLGLFILVSSAYWAPHLELIQTSAMDHWRFSPVLSDDPTRPHGDAARCWGSLLYLGQVAGWPLLAVALLSALALLLRPPRSAALLLLASGLGGAGIMSFTACDEARYYSPAVPALALLAALGIARLRPRVRAVAAPAVALALALSTLYPSVWHPPERGWLGRHQEQLIPNFLRPPEQAPGWPSDGFRQALAPDPQGERTLLLFTGADIGGAAHLAAHLAPRAPRALLGLLNAPSSNLLCGRWIRGQLASRRVLLFSVDQRLPFQELARVEDKNGIRAWSYQLPKARLEQLVQCPVSGQE